MRLPHFFSQYNPNYPFYSCNMKSSIKIIFHATIAIVASSRTLPAHSSYVCCTHIIYQHNTHIYCCRAIPHYSSTESMFQSCSESPYHHTLHQFPGCSPPSSPSPNRFMSSTDGAATTSATVLIFSAFRYRHLIFCRSAVKQRLQKLPLSLSVGASR